jgi:hypothetical protein
MYIIILTSIAIFVSIFVCLYFTQKYFIESFNNSSNNPPNNLNNTNNLNLSNLLNSTSLNKSDKSKSTELIIFVSESCTHCVHYNKYYHDGIVTLGKSKGINVHRVFSHNDPNNLFDKYNVMYVPTGLLIKDGKVVKNLGNNLNPESVKNMI